MNSATSLAASLDGDVCYRAIVARDTRFDGHFFTAVRTTGIYCRPVCPARTPRRRSCDFYRTAVAAEHAGFRPCLRCRPELAPGRIVFDTTLAEAIFRHLQAGALDDGSLERLAATIGLSSRQVRRIVIDHFGVTPIEVAQTQRLLFAKKLLQETALSMTQVAFAAGFGSVRRFNAAFRERYQLAPSSLRRAASDAADAADDAHGSIVLRLAYRPPFDWPLMAAFLARRATTQVERVDRVDGVPVYRRTATAFANAGRVDGWVSVTAAANPSSEKRSQADTLVVTLSNGLLPSAMDALQRLRELFDLDADPLRIAAHLAADPLLAPTMEALPGMRVPGAWDRFELALRAVLGQQVSVAGASTLSGRLAQRFGRVVGTPWPGLDRAAVEPEALVEADLADIAAIGVPRSRANTIRELARFAAAGGLSMPPGTSCDDAVARLDAVPGIGPWTAHYIAMRALRYPDAFPAGDLGLRKSLGLLEGSAAPPTEAALSRRAEAWRPWRAYAALALWHAVPRRPILTEGALP